MYTRAATDTLYALSGIRRPTKALHMLLEDVQTRLQIALSTTIVEEYSLFAGGSQAMPPSERAVVAQLAFRLRHVLEDRWDVDVEYGSRPTLGELRVRSRSLQLPTTADLAVHRRGRSGRHNNLLRLGLMMHGEPQLEPEVQRLCGLMNAYEYQHAAVLSLNPAYTEGGNPPAVVLPMWHWISAQTTSRDVYSKDAALAFCRRGHQRYSALSGNDPGEIASQLEMFPAVRARRVDVLQQLEARYGDWIRSDITSATFLQVAESFALEVRTRFSGDRIERVDLSGYFEPADPIEVNVAEFLRWDQDYVIMCTNLLENDAARAIAISLGYAEEEDLYDF